jgi:hypothetical protein
LSLKLHFGFVYTGAAVMCICSYSVYVGLRRKMNCHSGWLLILIEFFGLSCGAVVGKHDEVSEVHVASWRQHDMVQQPNSWINILNLVLTRCPEIRDFRLHHGIPWLTLICLLIRKRSEKKNCFGELAYSWRWTINVFLGTHHKVATLSQAAVAAGITYRCGAILVTLFAIIDCSAVSISFCRFHVILVFIVV